MRWFTDDFWRRVFVVIVAIVVTLVAMQAAGWIYDLIAEALHDR